LSLGQTACAEFFKSFVIKQSLKFLITYIPVGEIKKKKKQGGYAHHSCCICGMSGKNKEENLRLRKKNMRQHVQQNKN